MGFDHILIYKGFYARLSLPRILRALHIDDDMDEDN